MLVFFRFANHIVSVTTIQLFHYSTKRSHRQYVNERTQLCSNKTSFANLDSMIDLAQALRLAISALDDIVQ